jgi:hypothetical protein
MNKPIYSRWPLRWVGGFSSGVALVTGWSFLNPNIQILLTAVLLLSIVWVIVWAKGSDDHEQLAAGLILSFVFGVIAAWLTAIA